MDKIVYEALSKYYYALSKVGRMPQCDTEKLLILLFIWEYVYFECGYKLTEEDYHLMEVALDQLYGTTCLIPYPDYLKMGKLHLSEMVDLQARVRAIEDTKVVKSKQNIQTIPDIDIPTE